MKYFCITIDTECDCSPDWSSSNPLSFRSIEQGIPHLLQPLFSRFHAIPTYLVTTEVLENRSCVETLKKLGGSCELGTHLHPEFSPPQKKYERIDGVRANDFLCRYDEETEYLKLETITDLFTDRFGYRPLSFRAGRFGAGPSTIRSLQKLGYLADTSVTPHVQWESRQGTLDFTRAAEQPYYPDCVCDITRRGLGGVLEVPVSIYKPFLRGPRWLRPSCVVPVQAIIGVLDYLDRKYGGDSVANMMFHSMEVIPGASPYCATEADVTVYLNVLEKVLADAARRGYTFIGLGEAARIYKRPASPPAGVVANHLSE